MITLTIALLTPLFLLIGVTRFSLQKPGYSQVRDSISELGEAGSPLSVTVSWRLFAPVGLALLLLGATLWIPAPLSELHGALAGLACAVGVGYLGAALFPCDPGSPLEGSWRQQLHNLAGGVEYIGGAAALMVIAREFPDPTLQSFIYLSAGIVGLVAIGLSLPPIFVVRGIIQRVGETVLFANIALLTWAMVF